MSSRDVRFFFCFVLGYSNHLLGGTMMSLFVVCAGGHALIDIYINLHESYPHSYRRVGVNRFHEEWKGSRNN